MDTVLKSGSYYSAAGTRGLRPVFTLKSGLKITGEEGTETSPYTLGV